MALCDDGSDRLFRIGGPADVRAVPAAGIGKLTTAIREFLVDQVSRTGGHLGPNLGIVEITLALHRVFDSPADPILFDTGHQAYVHKIVTGRWDGFAGLRNAGGLSGYPSRRESVHDIIENSHASTALAYAHGIAAARAVDGGPDRVVVVVGDGALTGGMAWEALNNLGASGLPVVVVLNDNGRSYAPTVGGIAAHLRQLRTACTAPVPSNLFSCLGFAYLGPVDGHDVSAVEDALRTARDLARPVVVHCVTVKGKGYPPAEVDHIDCLHAVSRIDPRTGAPVAAAEPSWTSVFGEEILAIGERRPDVVCLTAAMLEPVGLGRFARQFPDRVLDVGIAEQHAAAAAAGLAYGGLHPVVALYATFLNRAFDQLLLDVALHAAPVTFVLDRAGVTGEDGASHHGMWDLALLDVVPGIRVGAPRDEASLRRLLNDAVSWQHGPTVVRFPKGALAAPLPADHRVSGMDVLFRHARPQALIVAVGATAVEAVAAARVLDLHGIGTTVIDPGWIYPVPDELAELAAHHRAVIVVEDGVEYAAGGAVARRVAATAPTAAVRSVGLPRRFIDQGRRSDILREAGISAEAIADVVTATLRTPAASFTTR